MESGDKVVDTIIQKFYQRSKLGQKKYGTTLENNNLELNEWIVHAQEELMDCLLYLEKIKNIDFEWNAKFILKVNERISSNLILHIQYDDDLINKLQIRELFGLGLSIDL